MALVCRRWREAALHPSHRLRVLPVEATATSIASATAATATAAAAGADGSTAKQAPPQQGPATSWKREFVSLASALACAVAGDTVVLLPGHHWCNQSKNSSTGSGGGGSGASSSGGNGQSDLDLVVRVPLRMVGCSPDVPLDATLPPAPPANPSAVEAASGGHPAVAALVASGLWQQVSNGSSSSSGGSGGGQSSSNGAMMDPSRVVVSCFFDVTLFLPHWSALCAL